VHIENIQCEDANYVLNRLRGRVFHVTTHEAYSKIEAAGEISNNKSAQFYINTNSQNSFGRLQGYVCLFDLRKDTPETISKTLDCYNFLGPTWFAKHTKKDTQWDLVYLSLSSKYYNRIIPNEAARKYSQHAGKTLDWIPETEVWIEEHLPLSWIDTTLIVKIKHPRDLTTPAGRHLWTVLNAHREKAK